MSPEILKKDPYDGRADLFSLGVVFFEMLTGKRPYDGPTWPSTMMNTNKGIKTADLRALAPEGTPEPFLLITEALIHVDASARVSSAEELLDLLGATAERRLGAMVAVVKATAEAEAREGATAIDRG